MADAKLGKFNCVFLKYNPTKWLASLWIFEVKIIMW